MLKLPTRILLVGATALALVGGGVAVAMATGSSSGTITACADKYGNMRAVSHPSDCKRYEKVLTWNKQGVPGMPGKDGTDGTDGVDGGLAGYEVVTSLRTFPAGTTALIGSQFAECPAGKVVTGGGGVFVNAAGATVVSDTASTNTTMSFPKIDGTGWGATFDGSGFAGLGITGFKAFALCVTAN